MATAAAQTTTQAPWQIDVAHSHVEFAVKHMMISTVKGRFTSFGGSIAYDAANPTATAVDISIDAASIDTRQEQRDNHLRSADFFDAAKWPTLRYVSRRVEQVGDGEYRLIGDLTIRDVTREVALDVTAEGSGKNPWGQQVIGFSAKGKIDRTAFGLTWNQALETGGILVGNSVRIEIDAQAVQQDEPRELVGATAGESGSRS